MCTIFPKIINITLPYIYRSDVVRTDADCDYYTQCNADVPVPDIGNFNRGFHSGKCFVASPFTSFCSRYETFQNQVNLRFTILRPLKLLVITDYNDSKHSLEDCFYHVGDNCMCVLCVPMSTAQRLGCDGIIRYVSEHVELHFINPSDCISPNFEFLEYFNLCDSVVMYEVSNYVWDVINKLSTGELVSTLKTPPVTPVDQHMVVIPKGYTGDGTSVHDGINAYLKQFKYSEDFTFVNA